MWDAGRLSDPREVCEKPLVHLRHGGLWSSSRSAASSATQQLRATAARIGSKHSVTRPSPVHAGRARCGSTRFAQAKRTDRAAEFVAATGAKRNRVCTRGNTRARPAGVADWYGAGSDHDIVEDRPKRPRCENGSADESACPAEHCQSFLGKRGSASSRAASQNLQIRCGDSPRRRRDRNVRPTHRSMSSQSAQRRSTGFSLARAARFSAPPYPTGDRPRFVRGGDEGTSIVRIADILHRYR